MPSFPVLPESGGIVFSKSSGFALVFQIKPPVVFHGAEMKDQQK